MKRKNICGILVILIIIFIIGVRETYGVISKNIDKKITNWISGGYTGWTEELTQEEKESILSNLKKDFNYEGSTINNEMRMLTKITVEDKKQTIISHLPWLENEYKYTLRIRNRHR